MADVEKVPEKALCEEILADADRQAERELRRARRAAEEVVEKARRAAAAEREAVLAEAREKARRVRELILASVAVESNRLRAAKVESLLQEVHDQARARLMDPAGAHRRDLLVGLMAEAIQQMEGDHFIIGLAEADRSALGEGWTQAVQDRLSGRAVRLEPEPLDADGGPGVVVRGADGRQVWDNRLGARLDRMWPALRRHLAAQASLDAPADPAGDPA